MHELLKHVLTERDLTRAGDLFAIPDKDIVDDLNEVIKQITEISSRPDYIRNDRDQALVEICVTRVTSCVKETGTLERYCGALVSLLESCLHHNLMPVGHLRDDDPPHAKIASDIIACIVLVSFPVSGGGGNECCGDAAGVMGAFLPVAVRFLQQGNREISRHMARFLSLASPALLTPHLPAIMDSIMSGNYPLCRVVASMHSACPEAVEAQLPSLCGVLGSLAPAERGAVFAVLGASAHRRPEALRPCLPLLLSHLCDNTVPMNDPNCMCTEILQVAVEVARRGAQVAGEAGVAVRRAVRAVRPPHAAPAHVALAATLLALLPNTTRRRAQEALNMVVERLWGATGREQAELARAATALCSAHPALFTDRLLHALRKHTPDPKESSGEVNRTSGGVTIVRLGGGTPAAPSAAPAATPSAAPAAAPSAAPLGYVRRAKLGDSRSTGRLHPAPHRSITRLNLAGGSVGGLHKSMTRLSSSQQINSHHLNGPHNVSGTPPGAVNSGVMGGKSSTGSVTGGGGGVTGGGGGVAGVTVTVGGAPRTAPAPAPRHPATHHHHSIVIGSPHHAPNGTGGPAVTSTAPLQSPCGGKGAGGGGPALGHVSLTAPASPPTPNGPAASPTTGSSSAVPTRRANNTSVTMITSSSANEGGCAGAGAGTGANHRMSVFEPYPLRDTVQHFCEKHLDKIKAYMDNVSLRLPPPAKCTIEERRSKKVARLEFSCGRRGPHCLYSGALFAVRTRSPRVWVHLMFLALQARQSAALSSRDHTVATLKHCWDTLKCDNRTFLTLVTGAFPGLKEQEMLVNELRAAGFFDVFEVCAGEGEGEAGAVAGGLKLRWACFLCAHPDRAGSFVGPGPPVMEGQLKEKKGRWRVFRRWRTRYFTLSAAHLSAQGHGETIDITQIRSVKVSRGARNIPKAFEIFTGDQTLILKPKDEKHAEQWAQCLTIAVAHSHSRDTRAHSLPARCLTLKTF